MTNTRKRRARDLRIGRIVYVRDLSTWTRGTITAADGRSVTVTTFDHRIHVHCSVYARDLRIGRPL
jgi:hypothetical protein